MSKRAPDPKARRARPSRSIRSQEPPDGFRYQADLLPPGQERDLIERIQDLPLQEFQFHGYVGKRRVISYGWHYSFGARTLERTDEIPPFLLPLWERAAAFAVLAATELPHALITEYSPGTAIGWHRDRGVFGDVIGVSLVSSCVFRLRRKTGNAWKRYALSLEPRSAYLLRSAARTEWQHSIPPVAALRYSVTFRSIR